MPVVEDRYYKIEFTSDFPCDDSWIMLQDMSFSYGEAPNTLSFQVVPPYLSEFDKEEIDLDAVYDFEIEGEHFFGIISSVSEDSANPQALNFVLESPIRGKWCKSRIFKEYSSVDESVLNEMDKSQQDEGTRGFYYRLDRIGSIEGGEEFDGTGLSFYYTDPSTNPLGKIYASHALLDIFNSFYLPEEVTLEFEIVGTASDELEEIQIDHTTFRDTPAIQAMQQILAFCGDFYLYEVMETKTKGKIIVVKSGEGTEHLLIHADPVSGVKEVINGQSTAIAYLQKQGSSNPQKDYTGIRYVGGKRQYLVERALLIPAWDWWNDYCLIVRDGSDDRFVPYAELPDGLRELVEETNVKIRDLDPVMGDSLENCLSFYLQYKAIMVDFVYEYAKLRPLVMKVTQNGGVWSSKPAWYYKILPFYLDYTEKSKDPFHQYRFTRYVAVNVWASGSGAPEMDDNDVKLQSFYSYYGISGAQFASQIRQYKNICPQLVSGRQNIIYQDVTGEYEEEALSPFRETWSIDIPPIVEAYKTLGVMEPYQDAYYKEFNLLKNDLLWCRTDGVNIDNEKGYFNFDDPNKTTFVLNATIAGASGISGEITLPSFTNPSGIYAELAPFMAPYYNIPHIGVQASSKDPEVQHAALIGNHIMWFRGWLRATFYHTLEFSPNEDLTYDQIEQEPGSNRIWFSGWECLPGYEDLEVTEHKFADTHTEEELIWQTRRNSTDSSPVSITYTSSSLGKSSLNDTNLIGMPEITLTFQQRDDRILIKRNAIADLHRQRRESFKGSMNGFLHVNNCLSNPSGLGFVTDITPLEDEIITPIISVRYDLQTMKASIETSDKPFSLPLIAKLIRKPLVDVYNWFGKRSNHFSKLPDGQRQILFSELTGKPTGIVPIPKDPWATLHNYINGYGYSKLTGIYEPRYTNLIGNMPSYVLKAFDPTTEDNKRAIKAMSEKYYLY